MRAIKSIIYMALFLIMFAIGSVLEVVSYDC